MAKWYMRMWLVFHTMHTDIREYTKQGRGLRVTAKYKMCCGNQYLISVTEDYFALKGKEMRRARRRSNG